MFPPNEADVIQFTHLRPQLTTRLRTQWDIRMVPSDLEFRYADLTGDVFQVRNDWTIMQLLNEYRPEWRFRQYSCRHSSPLVPVTPQPFILRLTCHKVRQGFILPKVVSPPFFHGYSDYGKDSTGSSWRICFRFFSGIIDLPIVTCSCSFLHVFLVQVSSSPSEIACYV